MTMSDSERAGRVYRSPMRLRGAAGLLVALIVLAGCGDDDADQADPEVALNTYADGINANSVDDAMAAFAEDSRMIDHPLNPGELNGKAQIRRGVAETVNNSQVDPDPYSISDVVVDGDTVSWSYVWFSEDGDEFCGFGNEIDVNNEGLIAEFRWPEDPANCDE
jgi:hypothetical protein